jgi:hypothetical protein
MEQHIFEKYARSKEETPIEGDLEYIFSSSHQRMDVLSYKFCEALVSIPIVDDILTIFNRILKRPCHPPNNPEHIYLFKRSI